MTTDRLGYNTTAESINVELSFQLAKNTRNPISSPVGYSVIYV